MIKQLIGDQRDEFLEKDDILDKWQSNLTASERRTLITKWLGQAWENLNNDYPNLRKKLFQKTGLLMMTCDGTGDNLIRPEGFESYTF